VQRLSKTLNLNVLVVDDNEDSADVLAELLRMCGHGVRVASYGQDALELVSDAPPDVVLLDVGLPDLDGYEVAALIRERFGRGIRLVALTGYSDAEAKSRAASAGFDVFLTKPCSSAELERALSP